jgi:hypothetical protein
MSETNFNSGPLHTLNPLGRFSDRATDYVKYRPTYPPAAVDTIVAGLSDAAVVADIGAGTGISEQLLADRGFRFKRILKPASVPGNASRLALVWNNRDQGDASTNEYSRLTIAVATTPVVHERTESARPLLSSADFTNVQEHRFGNRQALDLAGLLGRVRSNSYTPHHHVACRKLISDLEQLHDRFQDEQGLVYLC